MKLKNAFSCIRFVASWLLLAGIAVYLGAGWSQLISALGVKPIGMIHG